MLPSARHYRLKAAQQELIAAAGGIMRAAEICGYSKSEVGRWNNEDAPDWMSLDAADKLEQATGKNIFTLAWLDCRGLKLAEPDSVAAREACLTTEVAGFIGDFAAIINEWALVAADGQATPAEATRFGKRLADIKGRIGDIEELLAGVKAKGGIALVVGGAT